MIKLYKAPTGQIIYYHGKNDLTERGLEHIGTISGFNVSITNFGLNELITWTQYKRQQQ